MLNCAITVIIVNYNSTAFVELNLFALDLLTKNPFKVIICDNGSKEQEKAKLKLIVNKYENVELIFRQQTHEGSIGHGEALNILTAKIDTKYGVILDADAVLLIAGWDEILINELDDITKIIGTPPVSGNIKPTDFPLMYAILFETESFKKLAIDMRPKDISKGQDTGWEMREKYLNANLKAKVLIAQNTRDYKKGFFGKFLCAEYYHEKYSHIFACHFGRGSTAGKAKYKAGNIFLKLPGLEGVYKKIKSQKEKKQWISLCRQIIDKELVNEVR